MCADEPPPPTHAAVREMVASKLLVERDALRRLLELHASAPAAVEREVPAVRAAAAEDRSRALTPGDVALAVGRDGVWASELEHAALRDAARAAGVEVGVVGVRDVREAEEETVVEEAALRIAAAAPPERPLLLLVRLREAEHYGFLSLDHDTAAPADAWKRHLQAFLAELAELHES